MEYAFIFALGLLVGFISKGININIIHKEDKPTTPEEYNNTEHLLDPEVRQYFDRVVKD